MALLKQSNYSLSIRSWAVYPWMKVHGSIEADRCTESMKSDCSIHEWKFMALLKPWIKDIEPVNRAVSMNESSWLYWSIELQVRSLIHYFLYPWMKVHGSIEAKGQSEWFNVFIPVSMNESSWLYWSLSVMVMLGWWDPKYPWMKVHGSIEARWPWRRQPAQSRYPWMKVHGSIEAEASRSQFHRKSSIHEWKFMALLKQIYLKIEWIILWLYPWMKVHGSIEAVCRSDRHRCPDIRYPWMKVHGSIEASDGSRYPYLSSSWYPWMKVHGEMFIWNWDNLRN